MNNVMIYCAIASVIVIGVTKGINTKLKEQFGFDNPIQKEGVTVIVTLGATLYYAFIEAPHQEVIMYIITFIVIYIQASGIYQFTKKDSATGGQTPINSNLEDEGE